MDTSEEGDTEMPRNKRIRIGEAELDRLKEFKKAMYGEERADDIPHAAAVMDALDAVEAQTQFN
ncbi:hypothetical protein ACM16X_08855 [Haloarcula japonica]|uniref:hypothetical protein n=1 Tax=Haloarcula japonica TaxID=29282 RepID=UPI0039F6D5D5